MNRLMFASGVVVAGTAVVHLVAGQIDPVRPLLAATMNESSKWTLHACWHLVSADLVLAAAVLVYLARNDDPGIAAPRLISAHFLAYGLVFIVIGLTSAGPRGLVVLPQWVLLLPVAALAWAATVPSRRHMLSASVT